MLTIVYDPDKGLPIPDGLCDAEARSLAELARKSGYLPYLEVLNVPRSTENIFYALRVMVKRGDLAPAEIQFKFKDQFISIDGNGRCDPWPEGFCEFDQKQMEQLLTGPFIKY